MAVTTQVLDVVQCDHCGTDITDPTYVDAMVYGAAFHHACWERMNGVNVAVVLGLDDIRVCRTQLADGARHHEEITGGRYGRRP